MQKQIKVVKDDIVQVTTLDERWYSKTIKNIKTGLPEIKWKPSVTWIKSYYYMSPYLMKWIADKGLTESEKIKKDAGLKGDKIHQATEDIDRGIEISMDSKYLNKRTGEPEELTVEEYEAIMSYRDYIDAEEPELLANELTVFSKENSEEEYGGTLDRIFAKGFVKEGVRQIWIVDIKSSKSIYKDMTIQVSAYSYADINYKEMGITDEEWENRKLAILQVGYQRNKNGYKFTEIPSKYNLFQVAYQTWKEENPNAKPKQRDYPLTIQSKFRNQKGQKNK